MLRTIAFIFIMIVSISSARAQATLNNPALDSLVAACSRSYSSSYALWVDGEEVLSWSKEPGTPLPSYSILKSIASLAIGRLVTDGVLDSIDTTVYRFFPEWKQGYKKLITIRHLLNHTSGIESYESTSSDWEDADNLLQVALCTDLVSPAGTSFYYNNKASLLLLGVIGQISGMKPDRYIEEKIFAPLDIKDYSWEYDSAGNTKGLSTTSEELLKIGRLVLDKGVWNGEQMISEEWIAESLRPGQPYALNCGLLWWIIPEHTEYIVDDLFLEELTQAGIRSELIEKFRQLEGRYTDVNISPEKLSEVFGESWMEYLDEEFYPDFPARSRREYSEKILGYKAEGWLGQYIIIYPEKRIVATRMVEHSGGYLPIRDELRDFEEYVYRVVQ